MQDFWGRATSTLGANGLRQMTASLARRVLYGALALVVAGSAVPVRGLDIRVSEVQLQIYGTTTDVTGSGGSANWDANTAVDDYAIFDMTKDGLDYADLKITYAADNGSVGANMMIARTSNSQGLEDTGTVSILLENGLSARGGTQLRFDWYVPGSFVGGEEQSGSALLTDPILYTTFDIDYQQFVETEVAKLQSYALDQNTVLTPVDRGSTISFEDSGAESTFDEPTTAAQFLTRSGIPSTLAIDMGKQGASGNALFMFEFRDPSAVLEGTGFTPVEVPIPEPTTVGLIAGLLGASVGVRRRPGTPRL